MRYLIKVLSKQFQHEISKQAYLDACKWVAVNIINNKQVELQDITWNIAKVSKEGQLPTFKLTVYASINEKDVRENHCEVCKQVHNLFYMNKEEANCAECKLKAFQKRLDDAAEVKRVYVRGKIGGQL